MSCLAATNGLQRGLEAVGGQRHLAPIDPLRESRNVFPVSEELSTGAEKVISTLEDLRTPVAALGGDTDSTVTRLSSSTIGGTSTTCPSAARSNAETCPIAPVSGSRRSIVIVPNGTLSKRYIP